MNSSHCQFFFTKLSKITLWHKNIITHPDGTHIWSAMLCTRVVLIFQGVLTKFFFLMKFPHLEKIVNLMRDLKYQHQSIFPLCRRVKLNFRNRYRNHIFVYRMAALCGGAMKYQAFLPHFVSVGA